MLLFYSEKNNASENVDLWGKQLQNPWDSNDKILSVLSLYEHEHSFSGISALVHLMLNSMLYIFSQRYFAIRLAFVISEMFLLVFFKK